MSKHFIKDIEIKNFKCFDNFKAEGFGRVNLIGGKNNVGKTAFMEACFIGGSKNIFELYHSLLTVKSHRDILNRLAFPRTPQEYLFELIKVNDFHISSTLGEVFIHALDDKFQIKTIDSLIVEEKTFNQLSDLIQAQLGTNIQYATQSSFVSGNIVLDSNLNFIIGHLKIENKYEELNKYLFDLFNIESIDIINNIPYIKQNGRFQPLYQYGNGIKSFINIILPLLLYKKNNNIYIDELENGIHYSNFDKLWKIILDISKEKNVQVFATTHSKECIESYARVAKRLEDEEITMTVLARNPKNEIKALVYDDKMFYSELEQNHEVRGW